MRVKALQKLIFNTSKGQITVEAGQSFKPADPEKLIKAGLVEPLIGASVPTQQFDEILQMPLSQFKRGSYLVRVRCRHLDNEIVYLASTEREAAIGRAEGLTVYLATELIELVKSQPTPDVMKQIHEAKKILLGTLIAANEIAEVKANEKGGNNNAKQR